MAEAADTKTKVETVRVTVGHGKCVYHDGEIYVAGDKFEAPTKDAELLMKHGFLKDPNAPEAALPAGARVGLVASERR